MFLLTLLVLCLSSAVNEAHWGYGYGYGYNNGFGFNNGFNNNFFNNFASRTISCQSAGFTNGYVAAGCAFYNQATCTAAGGTCAFTRCGYLCCRNNTVVAAPIVNPPLPPPLPPPTNANAIAAVNFTNNVGACDNRGTVFGTAKCTDRNQCGANLACLNGICCPKGALASDFACGGDEAVAACFSDGSCGMNYNCINGYCCECPSGKQNGKCSAGVACPTNTTCNASGWCCSTSTTGVINTGKCENNAIPNGNCVGSLCPAGFTCVGSVCCPSA